MKNWPSTGLVCIKLNNIDVLKVRIVKTLFAKNARSMWTLWEREASGNAPKSKDCHELFLTNDNTRNVGFPYV